MQPRTGRSKAGPFTPASPKFVEPMLLLRTNQLPEGKEWAYELKFDGYCALALKVKGRVELQSRNDKDFGGWYGAIVAALQKLPDDTMIDGEVVAMDEEGRPSFSLLQNYGSSHVPLVFFAFDLLMLRGKNMMMEPLSKRREVLREKVLARLEEPIRFPPDLDASLLDLIVSIKAQGFEGLVAKRRDSTAVRR
jgi:bifunctional non-homologous end joining protein LigD